MRFTISFVAVVVLSAMGGLLAGDGIQGGKKKCCFHPTLLPPLEANCQPSECQADPGCSQDTVTSTIVDGNCVPSVFNDNICNSAGWVTLTPIKYQCAGVFSSCPAGRSRCEWVQVGTAEPVQREDCSDNCFP
jgi:hypothetical protein